MGLMGLAELLSRVVRVCVGMIMRVLPVGYRGRFYEVVTMSDKVAWD